MMRRLLGLVLVLPLTAWALAADGPKPNTLTPRESADGWLLLFDGDTTFGWRSPNDSRWTIAEGMLAPQADKPGLLVTTTAFQDYDLSLEYRVKPGSRVQLLTGCDADGRAPASPLMLQYVGGGWTQARIHVQDSQVRRSTFQIGGVTGATSETPATAPDGRPQRGAGHIALSGNGVVFRGIKLKPTDMKPLFDGKDLAGWKVFRGKGKNKDRYKSVFSVTPEGWLNIKNGPGDLQTEGRWADFILQLECISNGKHLNSGVFFRCRPDDYQQGYEAQIQNGFTDKPKTVTVEEYDARTHELIGKKKVQTTAVDWGTGAIYRRVPARRQAARDGEWFTLTVAAQGRHLATWVNGFQETDWTDNRPEKDNARNGCRLAAGPISLQGHDPTTNLSFRNIRIEDLAPGKKKPAGDR
jgi:hypothetical protein